MDTYTWEAAARLHFGLVLLCDTLSCLGRLHEYRWIRSRTRGRPTLVLYSGQAGGIYRTEAVRRLLAKSGAPVVALVPFDPSGLAKADATPRLETLALPDLAVVQKLAAHGTYDGDFALQVRRHRGQLDQAKHPEVAALWAAMQQLGNGVPISSFGLVA
jgi:hypothetical protein